MYHTSCSSRASTLPVPAVFALASIYSNTALHLQQPPVRLAALLPWTDSNFQLKFIFSSLLYISFSNNWNWPGVCIHSILHQHIRMPNLRTYSQSANIIYGLHTRVCHSKFTRVSIPLPPWPASLSSFIVEDSALSCLSPITFTVSLELEAFALLFLPTSTPTHQRTLVVFQQQPAFFLRSSLFPTRKSGQRLYN